jgi:hypothetical protein
MHRRRFRTPTRCADATEEQAGAVLARYGIVMLGPNPLLAG